jgi:hypothetical protein
MQRSSTTRLGMCAWRRGSAAEICWCASQQLNTLSTATTAEWLLTSLAMLRLVHASRAHTQLVMS